MSVLPPSNIDIKETQKKSSRETDLKENMVISELISVHSVKPWLNSAQNKFPLKTSLRYFARRRCNWSQFGYR